jgi:hypothetical protein
MHLPHIFRHYPAATESRSDFTASVTQDRKGQAVSREVLRLLARVCCEIAARSNIIDRLFERGESLEGARHSRVQRCLRASAS